MYFNNHTHSEYSNSLLGFPDVVNKVDELIQKAYDIGLLGVSITEHEGISSHVVATKFHQSMNLDRDFKLALGNEIYLMSEEEDLGNRESSDSYTPYYHFILTALDEVGHKQIRELSSCAWIRAYTFKGLMRRPTYYRDIESIVGENKGHIVASTSCMGGFLGKQILKWKQAEENGEPFKEYKINIHNFIKWCASTFGEDNFFLEVQPSTLDNKEQTLVNDVIWELSLVYGLKVIPTTDAHYLSKDSAFVHKTYLNSKEGDREVDDFYKTAYLMGADELRQYLSLQFSNEQIDEMFDNSKKIYDRVQTYTLNKSPMIPQIPLDKIPPFKIKHRYENYYSKYEEFGFYAHHTNIQDQYFFYRIEYALISLVENKEKDVETYIARLNDECRELRIISEAFNESMASYYTSMSKNVDLIWEADSLSMPARGSGAGFLVCYLLEITQIDPVPLGEYFPFWRHLSHERGVEIADIDNDSQASRKVAIVDKLIEFYGEDRVLNVATFSRLTAKTAIEKSVKGLGLSDEMGGYLKSLVPVDRGAMWSLSDCFYGNEEKGRKPVTEMVNEISKYEMLKECAFALEGLVVNRGIHPAGVVIGNKPYTESIACMRSPNGVLCTCYELHDSEYCSQTKVDMLTIIASDKIRVTMDLLVKYGHMEWQGDLKSTYWKYLHPDVLEYENKEMWRMIKSVYSVFQFDTPVSVNALNMTNPSGIMDISATNSLLRLMAQDGQEAPLDKYVRYKESIQNWFDDMKEFGLDECEMSVLNKYLGNSYGLADSQEKVMLISMDEKVSGFTLKEANKLRKSIAKKIPKVLEETKELFFDSGLKNGTRQVFLDYVWNVVFAMSFGYSFSQLHSYSYSVIALQELNLNYFYPQVYWNCACLTVESQSDEDTKGTTDYGKISKSIYKMKKHNILVMPPSINDSDSSFTPIEENNTILFGLGGMCGLGADVVKDIMDGRPYSSFKQFYDCHKNLQVPCGVDEDGGTIYRGSKVTNSKIVTLIKGGCFDFDSPNRVKIMKYFAVYESPTKTSLTTANMPKIVELNVPFPREELLIYRFKQAVINKSNFHCNDANFKSKKHYSITNPNVLDYFEKHYMSQMVENRDYYYDGDMLVVIDKALEKAMKNDLEKLKLVLNSQEVLDNFNKYSMIETYKGFVDGEDVNKWALESLSYYDREHELARADLDRYNVVDFNSLPEEPEFTTHSYGKNKTYRRYELSKIAGTIIGCNHNKATFTLLTKDDVVEVRVNKGQYAFYKMSIAEDGKVVEKPWLARGNKIIVSGYRNGDSFNVKKYANSMFQHSLCLIKGVNEDGSLDLQLERYNPNEEEN